MSKWEAKKGKYSREKKKKKTDWDIIQKKSLPQLESLRFGHKEYVRMKDIKNQNESGFWNHFIRIIEWFEIKNSQTQAQ